MKKLFFGLLTFFISIYLVSLIYIGIHVYDNTAKPSDAILVLGAKLDDTKPLNPCLTARVDQGVSLYKKHLAPFLIMSGGVDKYKGRSQASIMKELAQKSGVVSKTILLEEKSANTLENLTFTKEIMKQKHLVSVIIVSDPYHLPRAALLAKSLDISYTVSPALHSPCWSNYTFFSFDYFRDGFALLYYLLSGRISLS